MQEIPECSASHCPSSFKVGSLGVMEKVPKSLLGGDDGRYPKKVKPGQHNSLIARLAF